MWIVLSVWIGCAVVNYALWRFIGWVESSEEEPMHWTMGDRYKLVSVSIAWGPVFLLFTILGVAFTLVCLAIDKIRNIDWDKRVKW